MNRKISRREIEESDTCAMCIWNRVEHFQIFPDSLDYFRKTFLSHGNSITDNFWLFFFVVLRVCNSLALFDTTNQSKYQVQIYFKHMFGIPSTFSHESSAILSESSQLNVQFINNNKRVCVCIWYLRQLHISTGKKLSTLCSVIVLCWRRTYQPLWICLSTNAHCNIRF